MVSYLVTTETDHHWTWLKMRPEDERTATENIRCWMFYPLGKKKNRKTLGESPLRPYVQGLIHVQWSGMEN